MFLVAMISLIVILVGGLSRLLLALTSKFAALPPDQRTIQKQKLRMIGVANIFGRRNWYVLSRSQKL
jgi:hypothetical protein